MKALTRTRIILFALMIFGAFANFALNEWGVTMITFCELLMTLSFLAEYALVLINRAKAGERRILSQFQIVFLICFAFGNLLMTIPVISGIKIVGVVLLAFWTAIFLIVIFEALFDMFKRPENRSNYENFFLSMVFYGLYFKNRSWPGAGAILILSCLFLLPFYIKSTRQFYRANFQSGNQLILILTIGSVATIFLGIAFVAKTMHWPFGNGMYNTGIALSIIMLIGTIKWKYNFNNRTVSILYGLRLLKTHIVLIYFMTLIFLGYKYFAIKKQAPNFFSQSYPGTVYKMRDKGFTMIDREMDYIQLVDIYNGFVDNSRKNGFIK